MNEDFQHIDRPSEEDLGAAQSQTIGLNMRLSTLDDSTLYTQISFSVPIHREKRLNVKRSRLCPLDILSTFLLFYSYSSVVPLQNT
jgi:hypothetical protein